MRRAAGDTARSFCLAHALGQQGYRALRVDCTHAHDLGTSLAAQAECQRALFKIRHGTAGTLAAAEAPWGVRQEAARPGLHLRRSPTPPARPQRAVPDQGSHHGRPADLISAASRQAAAQVGLTVGPAGVQAAWIEPRGARYLHKPGLVHAVSRTGSLIPVQLLDQAAQGGPGRSRVWLEYAQAMQGMRTVSTTPGLKGRTAQVPLMPDTHDARLARVTVPHGAVLDLWGPLRSAPAAPVSVGMGIGATVARAASAGQLRGHGSSSGPAIHCPHFPRRHCTHSIKRR